MKNDDQWHDLSALSDIEPGDATAVNFGKMTLAIYDTVDGIYVSDARCTHAGANLCDGYFDGRHIECPLHQGLFDASTGLPCAAPATRALKMYESRVHNGTIQIRLT